MKLRLETIVLQEMVAKAVKGAANNKMIPITSLMAIELKDNRLVITTTDASNTLKIVKDGVEGDDFYVVVPVEMFSKLIAKTTADSVLLTLTDGSLVVKGNGTYTVELPLDEDGQLIKFPEYQFDTSLPKSTIKRSTVVSMLSANKAALADTLEIPCLTGYYCMNGKVITTDTFKVCGNKIDAFSNPVLIPAELLELLSVTDEEVITVQQAGGKILFTTKNVIIYGAELDGIDEFPVEAIEDYLETSFDSYCKVPKQTLLNVLDRLALFISPYDKNGLYLTFNEQELVINSKRSNGTEAIKYKEVNNYKPYTCYIDIELFRSQINAQDTETVELWYGHETAIKMVCGNVTQVVALLEDDRNE